MTKEVVDYIIRILIITCIISINIIYSNNINQIQISLCSLVKCQNGFNL